MKEWDHDMKLRGTQGRSARVGCNLRFVPSIES